MNITDNFLQENFLEELNISERGVSAGEVSDKGISKLKRAGIGRTKKQYLRGLNKGTTNILKKYGVKTMGKSVARDNITTPMGGAASVVDPQYAEKITGEKFPRRMRKGPFIAIDPDSQDKEILRRHEADEMRSMYKRGLNPAERETPILGISKIKSSSDPKMLMHSSPKVLSREKAITDFTTKYYKGKGSGEWLSNIRKMTGEDVTAKMSPKEISAVEKYLAKSSSADEKLIMNPKIIAALEKWYQKAKISFVPNSIVDLAKAARRVRLLHFAKRL